MQQLKIVEVVRCGLVAKVEPKLQGGTNTVDDASGHYAMCGQVVRGIPTPDTTAVVELLPAIPAPIEVERVDIDLSATVILHHEPGR